MLELKNDEAGWYQCSAELPLGAGYVVLCVQPITLDGRPIGAAFHFPVRPGRRSTRVFLTPKGAHSVAFNWLSADLKNRELNKIAPAIKMLSGFEARWLMHKRVSSFFPTSSLLVRSRTLLTQILRLSSALERYEETFHYRPRSSFVGLRALEESASGWPCLRWLAKSEYQLALNVGEQDWVVFRESGDQWFDGGLEALGRWQAEHPDAGIITFDEQQVAEGTVKPWFKPEWNLDFLLSSAYQGHSVAIRGDILSQFLPGELSKSNASADEIVDGILLAVAAADKDGCDILITHCPVIALQVNKPALDEVADSRKHWPWTRSKKLGEYFAASISSVDAAGRLGVGWQLHWPLSSALPLVSLCIPTRNGLSVLKPCLEAVLQRTSYENFEVLVIDNQSDCSATLEFLAELQARDDRVRVLRYNKPFNFSAINNFGFKHAQGEIFGLVNNDIEPKHPEWLTEMVMHATRPDIGCVGAKLYYPNGSIQHAGVVLGIGGVAGHAFRFEPGDAQGYQGRLALVQNYSAVTAACLLVRASVYKEAGGLDERLAVNYNDVDFCLKVKALGYRNLWTPHAELIHHESFSRGGRSTWKKRRRAEKEFRFMRKKWGGLLDADPAYHPALTLVHEDFSLRAGKIDKDS